jgi:hypothetical protein
VIELLNDDLDNIEVSLCTFLKKSEIENGNAVREAQKYLRLTEEQRVMEDSLPQARRVILEPPYLSLPEALIELVAEEGFTITAEKAQEFIKATANRTTPLVQPSLAPSIKNVPFHESQTDFVTTAGMPPFRPDNPPNLHFTKIIEARFETQRLTRWAELLRCAVKTAVQKNMSIEQLKSFSIPIQAGQKNDEGYHFLPDMNISIQGVDANKAWSLALVLAKKLNVEIAVRFRWREKDGAAYPGEGGLLQWKP